MRSPALVGLYPKSRYGECDEARAWRLALSAIAGTKIVQPVYLGRKKLGYAMGDPTNRRVLWCTFSTLKDLDAKFGAGGQNWKQAFFKTNTGGGAASNVIWYDLWPNSGHPAPPASPFSGTANTARSFTDTAAGSLYHGGNASPNYKQIVRSSFANSAGQTLLWIYDRVIAYDNCTYTTSPTSMINTVTAPRYGANGAGGLQICCTCISGTGAGPVALSALNYVNDQGSAAVVPIQTGSVSVFPSRSGFSAAFGAEVTLPYDAAAAWGLGPFVTLANQDLGVQSITSYQFSATDGANTHCLALMRPLAVMVGVSANVTWQSDEVTMFPNFEPVLDGAHLSFLAFPTPNPGTAMGYVEFAWT